MTPTETQAIRALMQLFPPHPTGFGKLSGFKPGTQSKNQWTEKTQATQQDYLHHLTANQTEPQGIGQYAKQGDLAHWLCFDIDVKGEQGRHIAFLLLEELEARGCIPYLEESTRGGFHVFLWPENKKISAEIIVKAARVIQQQLKAQGLQEAIEIYPASYETDNEYGGKYVNLPYRGALNDAQEYGETFLVYGDMGIPLSELDQIEETPHKALEALASLYQEESTNYDYVAPENALPEVWEALLTHLSTWRPIVGNRHEAMLAMAGAAKHANINAAEAETEINRLSSKWFQGEDLKGRNLKKEISDIIKGTYTPNKKVTGVSTLRRLGATIPKLPAAQNTSQIIFSSSSKSAIDDIKERIRKLPTDAEKALEATLQTNFWPTINALPSAEKNIALLALKRQTGITKTDALSIIKEASQELTQQDYRDIIIENWQTTGKYYAYISLWEQWFYYEEGVYKELRKESIYQRIDNILELQGYKLREKEIKDITEKCQRHEKIYFEKAPEYPNLLNVKNGLLDLTTLGLMPHTPEVLTFNQTLASYKENAQAPYFHKMLDLVAPTLDHQATLQEFIGYALTSETHLQKILYLKGGGGTGKGTFTRAVKNLLGDGEGHTLAGDVNVDGLNDNSPNLPAILNKRLLCINEISKRADLQGLKNISGEDPVQVNPKYVKPFQAKLPAKIIITANTWVWAGDDNANNSLDRRFIIIPFEENVRQKNPDPRISEKLKTEEELSGILLWALKGLAKLRANQERFTLEGDQAARLEYLRSNNPCIIFLEETCKQSEGAEVSTQLLYEHWKQWCEGYDVAVSRTQFNAVYQRQGGSGFHAGTIVKFTEKMYDALRVLGWNGVTKERGTARGDRGVKWVNLEYDTPSLTVIERE